MKNIIDSFFPCYIDITNIKPLIAFGWTRIFDTNLGALDKEDFFTHLMKNKELTDLFSEDKIRDLASEYFKYARLIKNFHIWYPLYITKQSNSGPNTAYADDKIMVDNWNDNVFKLYEMYRISNSVFHRLLYDQILSDLLWNSKLDPRNPILQDINSKKVKEYQKNASDKIFNESSILQTIKKYTMNIDKEGNILIKRKFEEDLLKHYTYSIKLMKLYKDRGDIEDLKVQLAKIFFINELIEVKYIYNKTMTDNEKKDYKKYSDIRANVLSSFKLYLNYILSIESDFDFNMYYENSKYSSAITIKHEQIRGIKKLFKTLIM